MGSMYRLNGGGSSIRASSTREGDADGLINYLFGGCTFMCQSGDGG